MTPTTPPLARRALRLAGRTLDRAGRLARDWRRGTGGTPYFDPYTRAELFPLLERHGVARPSGRFPDDPTPRAVAGFVLGSLSGCPCFSEPLTAGADGPFAAHLGRQCGQPEAVRAAFESEPSRRVWRLWEYRPDLRAAFPLGLTPAGLGGLAEWLFVHGRADAGLSDVEILWWLFERAEDPSCGLDATFRWSPEWQAAAAASLPEWVSGRYGVRGHWLRRARPTVPEPAAEGAGVNLLGVFRYPSGLREEAVQFRERLSAAGLSVSERDIPVAGSGAGEPGRTYDGLERFPVTLAVAGAAEPFDALFARAGLHPRPGVYRIAVWNWELSTLPRHLAEGPTLADEFWTPSLFGAEAVLRARTDRPVYVMPPGVPPPVPDPLPRSYFGLGEGEFVLLYVFDMNSVMERKNPLALVRAFAGAFRPDDRARLVLKVSRGDARPADLARLRAAAGEVPNVTVIDRVMSRGESFALMAACDAYASPHRGEGFGFTVAEAMRLGKPVIATDYSSTAEFLTADVGYPVAYRLVPVGRGCAPYPESAAWAEPDEGHLSACLRHVYDRPAEAAAVGAAARAAAERLFCPEAAARRVAERVRLLLSERR